MTNANYIQWLETMIVGCDDLGGMEREKAIYQNCLKKARNLGQTLPIPHVSGSDERWVCQKCGELVDGRNVTFEEYHEGCGGRCV